MKLSSIINDSIMVVWLENAWQVKNMGLGLKTGSKGWWSLKTSGWVSKTHGDARKWVVVLENRWWKLRESGGA
jgi:hypothetical protein